MLQYCTKVSIGSFAMNLYKRLELSLRPGMTVRSNGNGHVNVCIKIASAEFKIASAEVAVLLACQRMNRLRALLCVVMHTGSIYIGVLLCGFKHGCLQPCHLHLLCMV